MDKGFYEGVNLPLAYCDDCGHQELEMDICPKVRQPEPDQNRPDERLSSYSRVHGDTRLNDAKMAEIAERGNQCSMRYHNITHEDMLNGDGLRVVLWVAGCEHCCPEMPESCHLGSGGRDLHLIKRQRKKFFGQLDKPTYQELLFRRRSHASR